MTKRNGLPQAALQELDCAVMSLTATSRKLEQALDRLDDMGVKLLVALAAAEAKQATLHVQAAQVIGQAKDGAR